MAVALVTKCFDNGRVAEADFLLGIIRKLCQPLSEFVLLVDVRGGEWISP